MGSEVWIWAELGGGGGEYDQDRFYEILKGLRETFYLKHMKDQNTNLL